MERRYEPPRLRRESHDGWVTAARRAAAAVDPQVLADAFVRSLATAEPAGRSAPASFAIAIGLPSHEHEGVGACSVCGMYEGPEPASLRELEAWRTRSGGVDDAVPYLAFDLEMAAVSPTGPGDVCEGVAVGRAVVQTLRSASARATVAHVVKDLRMLKGNRYQRRGVLEVLAVLGVLRTPGHPSYRAGFVKYCDRADPPEHHNETAYPACWWRGEFGIDEAALREALPLLA